MPKLDLVGAITALLDSRRLAIPATIPEAKTLGQELRQFRARVTAAGHETMEADWRNRAHDDLVLALAIAAFLGEQGCQTFWVRIGGETFDGNGETIGRPAGPRILNTPEELAEWARGGKATEEYVPIGRTVTLPAKGTNDDITQHDGWRTV